MPELFSTVVDQFHLVVDCFRIMLRCIAMSVDRNQCDSVKFDIADVWARIQSVMQMMLTDYLDFKSKNSLSMNPNTSENSTAATSADINSFFVRRKTQRTKRESLFRSVLSFMGACALSFCRSKQFWSGPNYFGRIQIRFFLTNFHDLDLSKMDPIETSLARPKQLILDQNNLDGLKSIWTHRRTRHKKIRSATPQILL